MQCFLLSLIRVLKTREPTNSQEKVSTKVPKKKKKAKPKTGK